jgi:hypothetical protein
VQAPADPATLEEGSGSVTPMNAGDDARQPANATSAPAETAAESAEGAGAPVETVAEPAAQGGEPVAVAETTDQDEQGSEPASEEQK